MHILGYDEADRPHQNGAPMAKAKTQHRSKPHTPDPTYWAGKNGIGTGPVPIPQWTMHATPTVAPTKIGPDPLFKLPKKGKKSK